MTDNGIAQAIHDLEKSLSEALAVLTLTVEELTARADTITVELKEIRALMRHGTNVQ